MPKPVTTTTAIPSAAISPAPAQRGPSDGDIPTVDVDVDVDVDANVDVDVDEVVAAVATVSRMLVAVSARCLASVDRGITLAQFRMLRALDSHTQLSLTRLADQLGVNPSTAFRMAERLHSLGMLTRTANDADRREAPLSLTPTGRHIVAEVSTRRRTDITRIIAAIPRGQQPTLLTALHTLTAFAPPLDTSTGSTPPARRDPPRKHRAVRHIPRHH